MNIVNVQDDHYRYKRPSVNVLALGHHNNHHLTNLAQVAKALNRDPATLLKWLSIDLGAHVKTVRHSATKSDYFVFVGGLSSASVDASVDRFVEQFVACRVCGLPETELTASERRVRVQCNGCGNVFKISSDEHKLAGYLVSRRIADEKSKRSGRDARNGV